MQPVRLTRRVVFSSGHRYWFPNITQEENKKLFGKWASPFNHGHNYALEVTCEGVPSPPENMVVNIKDIDEYLQRSIVSEFDQKSINDEVPAFAHTAPTIENLLRYFQKIVNNMNLPVHVTRLRLDETPRLFGEWYAPTKDTTEMLTLTRTYEFCASHRLHCPELDDDQNKELFGKCNNSNGHGHNYILEVTVSGIPDEKTGMLVDIGAIDKVVNEKIVDRYDHRHLNSDIPEFANVNPTTEAVVLEIFNRLQGGLPAKLERVRLYETNRSAFEVTASND